MTHIIETLHLEKTYEDNGVPVHALKGIDIFIDKGEFTVLAGPSGSGKTTLLNLIGALDRPTKGKVLVEGEDISSYSRRTLSDLRLQKIRRVRREREAAREAEL